MKRGDLFVVAPNTYSFFKKQVFVFAGNCQSTRSLPQKNSATVPGPV